MAPTSMFRHRMVGMGVKVETAVREAQGVRVVMEELTRVLGVMAETDLPLTPLLMLVVAAVRQ